MDELLRELDSVFNMISRIPVTGDNVDLMAASREKLRRIYATINKMDKSKTNEVESAGD